MHYLPAPLRLSLYLFMYCAPFILIYTVTRVPSESLKPLPEAHQVGLAPKVKEIRVSDSSMVMEVLDSGAHDDARAVEHAVAHPAWTLLLG